MLVSKEVLDAYHQKMAEFTALFNALAAKKIQDSFEGAVDLHASGQAFLNVTHDLVGNAPELLEDEEVAALVVVLSLFVETIQNPDNSDAMDDLTDIAHELALLDVG